MKSRITKLAAAAAIALGIFVAWGSLHSSEATAAEVLAQAVQAASNLRSVYIKARMRTIPHDNFELIGLNYDFVPHEMWKEFGEPPRWRIDKPGRVVVMDGTSSVLFIRPRNYAAKGGVDTGFVLWLKPLLDILDIDQALDHELRSAREHGWDLTLDHEEDPDGVPKLVVTVEAQAQGDFTNDWLKNKSISGSDNRRVYRFDAETKLLEGLQVFVHADQEDILVFEITEIECNPDIDPSLFSLALPDNVIWHKRPQVLADNEKYQQMSPEQTARAFFQACADEDWDEVLKFWSATDLPLWFKQYLGGLEIIHVGKAFKSGLYPGRFVPYEIKLKSGQTKKFNLAVRNDNPAKRYVVDGGL